ncbi:DUF2092 domain-containing protein [Fischerella sp. PCC 9605]|uniref:DUF2092 domain-containing protein n=1 Tax=Fischerella sp. PCC 9605 TaxID=1173024 RepID=UPI0006864875|nr:DUF2092 domain-containing protein [Fischerella sp. PCC 9605]
MLSIKHNRLNSLCAAIFLTLGLSQSLLAQETSKNIEPRAEQLLQQMSKTLQTAREFTFQAEATRDEVSPTGQKIQYSTMTDVAVRRPNRLRADVEGDRVNRSFWYDGRSITLLVA